MRADAARWPLEESHLQLIALVRETGSIVRQGEKAEQSKHENTFAGWVSAIYTTRCTRNLRAVAALCEAGYASEAAHIVRAMLEDAVTVAYIAADEETRAKQYMDFEETRAYHYMQEALQRGYVDEKTERARELTAKFADAENLDTLWWSGRQPSAMAGKLPKGSALRSDFFGMYPLLSDDAQGNAMSAGNYLVQDSTGATIALVDAPTVYRVDEMACLAIYCAWRLAEAAEACGVSVPAPGVGAVLEKASVVYRAMNGGDL